MNILIDYQINVENITAPSYDEVQTWADEVVKALPGDKEVSIRIVDADEMTYYNETFRKKTGPTNVLSFPDEVQPHEPPSNYLGDIAICAEVVQQEAEDQNKSLQAHWAHLVIHGLLHLLGYDHVKENEAKMMEQLETKLLLKLGFSNPYD
ncbi:MAG: rRNA maturation RNase YbeY [Coxiellaceae bacterium]|nr:rRNA maturation RNase YbeY [Coxiellaceae bacterium]